MYHFQEYLRSGLGQAVMLTFAGTAAAQGLVAIWAATGRVNWFIRALAVWGGVMLLVPIRVYEPAAVFAIASPLTIALISGVNWLDSGQKQKSDNLPMRGSDLWAVAFIAALTILACESIFQGHWWFDPMAFLAWGAIVITIVATMYDCIGTRGRVTWQRLLSLWRLTTTSLHLATASLHDQPALGHGPGEVPPARPRMRFGLRDLFFLVLLVALVIVGIQSIDQRFTWQEWVSFSIWGALISVIVSLAYGCVVSRWRLILAPLLAVAVAGTARAAPSICGRYFAERFIECLGLGRAYVWTGMQKLLVLEIVYAEIAMLIMAVLALNALSQSGVGPPPVRRLAGGALAAVTIVGGCSLAWLYWQMLWLTPIPPAFAGGRTHFDEIAVITRHADPRSFWGSPIPPVAGDTPRKLAVDGERHSLIAELSPLLSIDNHVPFSFPDRVFREEEVIAFRRGNEHFCSFAQVIDDEAIRASMRGDYEGAAKLALINVRLGTMLRRGGTETHAEAGKYCESYGYQRLARLRGNLPPETTRNVLAAISRAAALPEDRAIVRARGQAFEERAIGWTERLRNVFYGLRRGDNSWNPNTEIDTFNILLQTDLAIRLFQHDRGELPESLDELVPGYLLSVPLDPLAKAAQPLQYRVENGQFILYSVNSFGEDNGGTFGDRVHGMYHSTHDIDLETWIRP